MTPNNRAMLEREQRKRDLAKQARSALASLIAFGSIEERGNGLTDGQRSERRSAVDRFNATCQALGIEDRMDPADVWPVDSLRKLDETLERIEGRADRLRDMIDQQERHAAAEPAWMKRMGTSDDGTRGHDYVRQMLESGETRAEIDLVPAYRDLAIHPPTEDETRAIADSSDSASLYTSDFARIFALFQRTASPWLNLATIVHADNGRPLVVPGASADPTSYTPGESTAISESSLTLDNATVTPVSYKNLTYLSAGSVEDAEFDLTAYVARTQARSLAQTFGSAATAVVLAGLSNGGTAPGAGGDGTATVSFFGFEDLIDLQMGRAAPYRAAGSWVMANGALSKVRKFKSSTGEYLWPSENLVTGQPPTLLGRPAFEDPYLASPASATQSVIFGDLGAALVVKMSPLRLAISRDWRFAEDDVAVKSVQRIAIAVVDSAAAAYLVSAAT